MNDATPPGDPNPDLLARLKNLAQPVLDSLDARLRDQIDRRVDERVDATLATRLAVIERAIADLDRTVKELQLALEKKD